MKISLCTIAFRHELVSLGDLVDYAALAGFDGIELWGGHAKTLARDRPQEVARQIGRMADNGLAVSMISDYIDWKAVAAEGFAAAERQWLLLADAAEAFRTDKIRVFAGNRSSAAAGEGEWELCVGVLRRLAELSAERGVELAVETHPGTLADTLESTLRLLRETDHPRIKINLDFLHLWESGCDPMRAYRELAPWTTNYHLKNIAGPGLGHVFASSNVYSPVGERHGMTALARGAIDYERLIGQLARDDTPHPAAIEWFGQEPMRHLQAECAWIRRVERAAASPSRVT